MPNPGFVLGFCGKGFGWPGGGSGDVAGSCLQCPQLSSDIYTNDVSYKAESL